MTGVAFPAVAVQGMALDEFAPLRDVFARGVANQGVGGAALCIYRDGRKVVDLWAGDYEADSVQLVYSVAKSMTTVAVGMAVDEGLLDLDQPMGSYWPEMRKASTAFITLRDVMSHRSGLYALREPLDFDDIEAGHDQDAVALVDPWWEPGTRHGYHAFTFGSLVDGAFLRTVGLSVGEFLSTRIAGPLGLDVYLGSPDDVIDRIAPPRAHSTMITAEEHRRMIAGETVVDTALIAIDKLPEGYNDPRFLRASLPAGSCVADARSLAHVLSAAAQEVDGKRLLSAGTLADLVAPKSYGLDARLGVITAFGTGFQIPFPQLPFSGPRAFGHEAAGGSFAFYDPDLAIGVGYTTSVFPHMHGASIPGVALMAPIRHCAEWAG